MIVSSSPRHGRGRRPLLRDAELLSLAVALMLLGFDCERRWIRHLHGSTELRELFPYVPCQSGDHKRLKAARGLLCKAIGLLGELSPSWFDDLWITDATPVRCGTGNGETFGATTKRSLTAYDH